MKFLNWLAYILLIIGGLNWGLVGLFNWNLVHAIFGGSMMLERIIYILVGLGAIWALFYLYPKSVMTKASQASAMM